MPVRLRVGTSHHKYRPGRLNNERHLHGLCLAEGSLPDTPVQDVKNLTPTPLCLCDLGHWIWSYMENIGRYMPITMPPTTTPTNMIMMGSIMLVSCSVSDSTS